LIAAVTVSSASLRRPETITVQPSAASASAPACPMPLPPPVTHATRFADCAMEPPFVALVRRSLLSGTPAVAARNHGTLHDQRRKRQSVLAAVRSA
jgi:hypothetical protein